MKDDLKKFKSGISQQPIIGSNSKFRWPNHIFKFSKRRRAPMENNLKILKVKHLCNHFMDLDLGQNWRKTQRKLECGSAQPSLLWIHGSVNNKCFTQFSKISALVNFLGILSDKVIFQCITLFASAKKLVPAKQLSKYSRYKLIFIGGNINHLYVRVSYNCNFIRACLPSLGKFQCWIEFLARSAGYIKQASFYTARSAGQKGCVNMLQLGFGWWWWGGGDAQVNQSEWSR
jgi:hypothetical protein